MKKIYATALDYRADGFANKSTKYDETVSIYIAKTVKKFKSQIRANFFDPKEPMPIVGFLATFRLVWETNRVHEGAARDTSERT